MDNYYNKEKIYNALGIFLTLFFICQGWQLIFGPVQIAVIVIVRMAFLQKTETVQSFLLLVLLYIGYLLEYHYIIIHYFEYILLLFFLFFLIYNIYLSSSTKKPIELIIVILSTFMLLFANFYISNTRLFKDPQLHKTVSNKYEFQFLNEKSNLREVDQRLEKIRDLDIENRWSVRSLDGIENFSNLKDLDIYNQDKLMDYSNLKDLVNLERIYISDPHLDFSINDFPELNKLRRFRISLGRDQTFNDEIINLKSFPNLENFSMTTFGRVEPITIDIRDADNIESIDILGNVEEIVGLKEAKNLKEIRIYPDEMNYSKEIKNLRPDISTR